MDNIYKLYASHKGKVSDKWDIYLREYEDRFSAYKNKDLSILEIGVQNGGSLEIWSKYFRKAKVIVGCDINEFCSELVFEDPRIKIVVGDSSCDDVKIDIEKISNRFDLIIDDGAHTSDNIIKNFILYFPLLKNEGLYVIEDLHCSYWGGFQGGLNNSHSSVSFLKLLIDTVNYQHWGIDKSRSSAFSVFSNLYGINIEDDVLSQVHSIEFANSLCFIKKSPDNEIHRRIVAGEEAKVWSGVRNALQEGFVVPSQYDNPFSASLPIEQELNLVRFENQNLKLKIIELENLAEGYRSEISTFDSKFNQLSETLNSVVLEKDSLCIELEKSKLELDFSIEQREILCSGLESSINQIANELKIVSSERDSLRTALNESTCEFYSRVKQSEQRFNELSSNFIDFSYATNLAAETKDIEITELQRSNSDLFGRYKELTKSFDEYRADTLCSIENLIRDRDRALIDVSNISAIKDRLVSELAYFKDRTSVVEKQVSDIGFQLAENNTLLDEFIQFYKQCTSTVVGAWVMKKSSQSIVGLISRDDLMSRVNSNIYSSRISVLDILKIPSNEHFIEILYKNLLNREVDEPGRRFYINSLNNGCSRISILFDIKNSREARVFSGKRNIVIDLVSKFYYSAVLRLGRNFLQESDVVDGVGAIEPDRIAAAPNLIKAPGMQTSKRAILFISHDASMTGAPAVLVQMIKWMREQDDISPYILVGGNVTDRIPQFCDLGTVLHVSDAAKLDHGILESFLGQDISIVVANTVASAELLQHIQAYLKNRDVEYVAYLHEKKGVLDYFSANTRYMISSCDRFLVVAPDIKQELITRGLSKAIPVEVIPPFINDFIDNDQALERFDGARYIFGCGTVEPRKGFDLFCKTLNFLKSNCNIQFKAVWIGSNHDSEYARMCIKESRIEDIIDFVSGCYNPRTYYRPGDIFFMSSREDPFPLVCLEASERGLPIVCFDNRAGETANWVRANSAGLICNYLDSDDAALCLRQLLENPDMAQQMGENGSVYVKRHHLPSALMPSISKFVLSEKEFQKLNISKILVVSFGPVPIPGINTVEGGGLRSWGLARGLCRSSLNVDYSVTLTFPAWYTDDKSSAQVGSSVSVDGINLLLWKDIDELICQISKFDVVIVSYCYGDYSIRIKNNIREDQLLVLDCYVPIHSEVCARVADDRIGEYQSYLNDKELWQEVLLSGDLLLCANEAQKNYYLGMLFALGGIDPLNYEVGDNLIIAPFGIESEYPLVSTKKPFSQRYPNRGEAMKILWFGGVYPWFDIKAVVEAVVLVNKTQPCVLVIVGARNPFNNHPEFLRVTNELERLVIQPSYKGVVYLEDWVDYSDRIDWYRDADILVSINQSGIENTFAWRTRVLDYLWAEVPFVTNGGDPICEKLIDVGLGYRINVESPESIAKDILDVISNLKSKECAINRIALQRLKSTLEWKNVGSDIISSLQSISK